MSVDKEVDVVVFGSGAAGLAAALTASAGGMRVLLCEKGAQIGGTSATSGGTCWVPGNDHATARGVADSLAEAARYLDREIGAPDVDGRRAAFLASAGPAFRFIEANSECKFALPMPYPDYHPHLDGWMSGGRALQPLPFDGRRLGRDFALVRAPNPGMTILSGLMVNRPESALLARPWLSPRAFAFTAKSMVRHARDRLGHARGTRLLLGNALVASLFYTLRMRGVEIWTNAMLVALNATGRRVDGAICRRAETHFAIRAKRAVVLATGGFVANAALREALAPRFPVQWTLATGGSTGDAMLAAQRIGATVELDHVAPMFFMPASVMRPRNGPPFPFPHVIADRARPGVIAVNGMGRRFVNEADSYHDFAMAMYSDAKGRVPSAFLICDRAFVRRYGIGLIRPVWQRVRRYVECGYAVAAPTIEMLAMRIGVSPEALAATIARYNTDAVRGDDRDFGKGSNALNRFNGDPTSPPNPCLRPIQRPPYFAVPVYPAAVGTSVGLRTDAFARVLDGSGMPFDGLYACGNDQASIMKGAYPGAGITLGPAMTFAYRAMRHAIEATTETACVG